MCKKLFFFVLLFVSTSFYSQENNIIANLEKANDFYRDLNTTIIDEIKTNPIALTERSFRGLLIENFDTYYDATEMPSDKKETLSTMKDEMLSAKNNFLKQYYSLSSLVDLKDQEYYVRYEYFTEDMISENKSELANKFFQKMGTHPILKRILISTVVKTTKETFQVFFNFEDVYYKDGNIYFTECKLSR